MIVLDTHAWIWWVDQSSELSPQARRRIDGLTEPGALCVSSISVWEFHMLVKKGRLRLKTDPAHWIRQCELSPRIRFIPVDNEITRLAVELPSDEPSDPADRIILATGLALGAPVLSKDEKLRRCPGVKVVW